MHELESADMLEQLDLLTYNGTAGFRDRGAGRDAAYAITQSGKRSGWAAKVLALFEQHNNLTPGEAAKLLETNILNIRPRFSELERDGYLFKTDFRRASDNGNPQHVYKVRQ